MDSSEYIAYLEPQGAGHPPHVRLEPITNSKVLTEVIKAKYTVDTGTAVAGGVAMASALAGIDSYRMGLDLQLIASGELARASFPSQATAKGPAA